MTVMVDDVEATEYSYGDVARIPSFRKLWLGDLASQTADRMAFVAITILAYGESASSIGVSLIIGAYFLPAVLVSIPGGVIADRYARRTVMVAAESVRVLIALLMALLGVGLLLIGLVLVFSSLTYLFYPSRQASIPSLVPNGALMPANAAISANLILGFAVGPVIGGVVASMYGAEWALLIAAVVMAEGVVIIASISEKSVCTPARDGTEGGWSSLSEGLGEIRKHPILWQGFVLVVFVMLAVGAGSVGLVVYGDQDLDMGKEGFSILLAALAIGTLAGAIMVGRVGQTFPKGRLLVSASLLAGIMLVLLAQVEVVFLALVIMFLVGISAALVLVPFTTMLQERLGDQVMGTGFGMLSMGLTAPLLVGVAIAGPFIEARGVLDLFIFLGFVLLAVGIVSLATTRLWKVSDGTSV
ncbi:MAG: MFS transporter [Thermoplasmata archaeon]|nr:MFS transporter [Thermoplasmata archaeon]